MTCIVFLRVHYSTLADKVMQVLLIWKRHAPSPDERSLEDLLQSNGFRVSIPYSTGHGNGQMNEWTDGWMDGWIDGWKEDM